MYQPVVQDCLSGKNLEIERMASEHRKSVKVTSGSGVSISPSMLKLAVEVLMSRAPYRRALRRGEVIYTCNVKGLRERGCKDVSAFWHLTAILPTWTLSMAGYRSPIPGNSFAPDAEYTGVFLPVCSNRNRLPDDRLGILVELSLDRAIHGRVFIVTWSLNGTGTGNVCTTCSTFAVPSFLRLYAAKHFS